MSCVESNNNLSDNSDNISCDNEPHVKIRKSKKEFYSTSRDVLFNNLMSFVDLDDDHGILLNDLYNNQELKDKLNNISDDVKKYYKCSSWGYFVSQNNDKKGDEISLLKAIAKDHDYFVFSKSVTCDINNLKKRYTKIFFIKK